MIAIEHGVSADRLEALMRAGDTAARNLAYTTSTEKYPNLVIIDQALTFDQMTVALAEAQDWWQAPCDGVIIDYLDLLPGDADYNGTKGKSTRLKRWTKQNRVATVCIHQPKRGGAQRAGSSAWTTWRQGGETEATFVLGVYRRREDPYAADDYVAMHQNSITRRHRQEQAPALPRQGVRLLHEPVDRWHPAAGARRPGRAGHPHLHAGRGPRARSQPSGDRPQRALVAHDGRPQ